LAQPCRVHDFFVKFSDTCCHVDDTDSGQQVSSLIAFWSYALAACLFASIMLWRLRGRVEGPSRHLVGACFATAAWASVSAIRGPVDVFTVAAETCRNLSWIMLLHAISGDLKSGARTAVRLVFAAVALVIGLQLILDLLMVGVALPPGMAQDFATTEQLLRITMASGALVLVHNVYGQAAPESRSGIRTAMLGLVLMWGYDLNLYTLAYLDANVAPALFQYRGVYLAAASPLFIIGASAGSPLRIKLSRAAAFQSLSLLAICVYFVVMAVLAAALRGAPGSWSSALTAALLAGMMIATAVLVLSEWARGWAKVKLAKHLFEHRYDYRTEWLRFTDTLGRAGPTAPPLGERIIKAFADIVDAPGGLLVVADGGRVLSPAAEWNWPGALPRLGEDCGEFWNCAEMRARVIEFSALRQGCGRADDLSLPVPPPLLGDERIWVGVPLVHQQRLIGMVLLAVPDYRRPLDWEDFDLLRTAGGQAASSLAEAQGQEALGKAQRFEEFNRRFAFILHDVKNLVSQLSLLSRNAERHADNPEFRADMLATLKSSVGKMNELLTRLSPGASARVRRIEAQPLNPLLTAAIAAKRGDHDVRLLGDTAIWTKVDGPALEQALGHLIQNAVEACSRTSPVVVRAETRGSTIAVMVSDSGIGMDSDFIRSHLFQPFSSTKQGGFGIGSFEARSIINAMGGRIEVDSRLGQGTTFTILVPAAASADAAEPAQTAERKRA
jgi:putative PEP-CTERM system histidine kinase